MSNEQSNPRINIVKQIKNHGLVEYDCCISPDKPRFHTESHNQFAGVINWLYRVRDDPRIPDEVFIRNIMTGGNLSILEYSAISKTKDVIREKKLLEKQLKETRAELKQFISEDDPRHPDYIPF